MSHSPRLAEGRGAADTPRELVLSGGIKSLLGARHSRGASSSSRAEYHATL